MQNNTNTHTHTQKLIEQFDNKCEGALPDYDVQKVIIVGALGLRLVNCQVRCFDACLVSRSA